MTDPTFGWTKRNHQHATIKDQIEERRDHPQASAAQRTDQPNAQAPRKHPGPIVTDFRTIKQRMKEIDEQRARG